jgi:hypothetical protein
VVVKDVDVIYEPAMRRGQKFLLILRMKTMEEGDLHVRISRNMYGALGLMILGSDEHSHFC